MRIVELWFQWLCGKDDDDNTRENDWYSAMGNILATVKVAFHYSSQLQTWSKTWSQTCMSVSQAGRKQVESKLRTYLKSGDFFTHVCDMT